ncbi:MAG: ABC transporter substrate-binding protein [Flavobacteriaceae bacterium]|nr:ABC transporter substrate-binding protein [Flavobacteriaceae bacterium]
MKNNFKFISTLCVLLFLTCKEVTKTKAKTNTSGKPLELKYAQGFTATTYDTHTVIEIKNPWPNTDKTYTHEFSNDDLPLHKIVVTSTTHISALELLGAEQTLIGFPGTDYISSESIRQYIDKGKVRELGKNEGINTEVLLELQPDIVVGFGVDGTNKTFNTIKKAGIPVIYNGDWVETTVLAKAEWIKFFGVLFDKQKEADSIFNRIEADYLDAKTLAKSISKQPTVLCGAMHKDVWYLPSGTSAEAQFLKDANVNYLWQDTAAKGSLSLSFETVFEKGRHADLWFSPSYYTSLEALRNSNHHYTKFEAFENKSIFSFSNTIGATGGVLYYEQGSARPDLVLKDIIKICHPNLLENYQPYFFKRLK